MAININEMDNPFSDLDGFLKAYKNDGVVRILPASGDVSKKDILVAEIETLLITFFGVFNIDVIGKFNFEVKSYNDILVVEAWIMDDLFLNSIVRKNKTQKILNR
jgi:ABC-type antimicrobial peptide transport system permease subunit